MDLSYWKMSITDYVVVLNKEEAMKVVEQYERGDKILMFTDLFGSESFVPAKDFHGLWYTDFVIRQASTQMNDALKQEEKEHKNSWED